MDNAEESVANVIDGPDIQALSINFDQLESIRSSFLQNDQIMNDDSNKKSKKIMVRKEQLDFVDHKLKSKYLVTKKGMSQSDREIQKHAPIMFDREISENNILGSMDQFLRSAIAAGDLDENHSVVQKMLERERASSSLTDGSFQAWFNDRYRCSQIRVTHLVTVLRTLEWPIYLRFFYENMSQFNVCNLVTELVTLMLDPLNK